MELSVEAQALSLLGGLLLGGSMGLVYDLFRILRWKIPLRGLGAALDLIFWVGCTAALFLYAQWAERGEVRGYLALSLLVGGGAYFALISPLVRKILNQILRILGVPLRMILAVLKKIRKKQKNLFSSLKRWYKMKMICKNARRNKESFSVRMEGKEDVQDQAGRTTD